jgi:prolyl-tRNA editing enzyme YbaK/EbsC (Cys-tRNA(Pro) deacylase)
MELTALRCTGKEGGMSTPTFERVKALLDHAGIQYRAVHHEPTRTSEESARARGEPLEVGGKALLLKVDGSFKLFVLSATRKLDSGAVRKKLGARKTRFASAEELDELTGLAPGSVPPFGEPILPFELYVDESVTQNDRIAFNAGSLTDSVIMTTADYLRLAEPEVFSFTTS